MRLQKAIGKYLKAVQELDRSEKTVKNYEQRLRRFTDWLTARTSTSDPLRLKDVRREVLKDYKDYLAKHNERYSGKTSRPILKGPLSKDSQHSYLQAIKTFLAWCVEAGYLQYSPGAGVRLPKLPRNRNPKAVADDDVSRLLFWLRRRCAINPKTDYDYELYYTVIRDYAMLLVLADSGCRVGGLVGLTVYTVHPQQGYATVTEKGEETRDIIFSGVTGAALAMWLRVRQSNTDAVWVDYDGNPLTVSGVYQALRRRGKAAGCRGPVNPHGYRHRAAIKMLQNGCDLAAVSEILGHSDVRTTIMFYARWTTDQLQVRHRKYGPLRGIHPTTHRDDKRLAS